MLFAVFLSAFLIELLGRLEQDPMDVIQDVLIYQTQMMRNSSLGPYVPPNFSPPEHVVLVNALFYASLSVMILAAFTAMLIKSWVREFDRGLRAMTLPEQRAKTREFRYLGMERWRLPEMVGILPLLIQISLFLFSIGLVLFLFHVSKPSFGVTTAIFGAGVLYYTSTTSISVFVTSSPFHSPLSRTLGMIYWHAHAYFCPSDGVWLSKDMDDRPTTAWGRLRRGIQSFLQALRPYPESSFVEPVASTTMDEFQLFMSASALQRIHESVPDSQHSEPLQSAVWQVAGSTALRIPPLFDLPSWIVNRGRDKRYLSHLPPTTLVALLAVCLRSGNIQNAASIITVRTVLQDPENSNIPWMRLVTAIVDRLLGEWGWLPNYTKQTESNNLITMIRRMELQGEECLWLLNTLSELWSNQALERDDPFLIGVCLALLMAHAPKWDYSTPPEVVLLEGVVTLAAISCSRDTPNGLNILTRSRERPWLLQNLRSPHLISALFEGAPSDYRKQLTSLLLLVVYGLLYRRSYPLAVQYFTIITEKGDLPLYTSALTAIAPSIHDNDLAVIGRMLVAPQNQVLMSIPLDTLSSDRGIVLGDLLHDYDNQLGASENPDPNIFAVLLVISKDLDLHAITRLQNQNQELNNPWLRLAARVIAQLNVLDEPDVPTGLFYDHRVHNMIAALSLLRYTEGNGTQYAEPLLLASFLDSREVAISAVALEYYMKTTISYPDPSTPPYYLSRAVRAVFNPVLPDHQLPMGWASLEVFVNGFEELPVECRRTFAEAFFTLSRQPLPRPQEGEQTSTPANEIKKILTWEYFHKEEHKPVFTDSDFCGLDWMALAWSLHRSQRSRTKAKGPSQGTTQSQDRTGLMVNERFTLRALCKLLESARSSQIIPIIPKLREFFHWFDDSDLPEYCKTISAHIDEAARRHQEFQMVHKFDKFHCMWYI
jgi:hypothetical protein